MSATKKKVKPVVSENGLKVLRAMKRFKSGKTTSEILAKIPTMTNLSLGPTLASLKKKGFVKTVNSTPPLQWLITSKGRDV